MDLLFIPLVTQLRLLVRLDAVVDQPLVLVKSRSMAEPLLGLARPKSMATLDQLGEDSIK